MIFEEIVQNCKSKIWLKHVNGKIETILKSNWLCAAASEYKCHFGIIK